MALCLCPWATGLGERKEPLVVELNPTSKLQRVDLKERRTSQKTEKEKQTGLFIIFILPYPICVWPRKEHLNIRKEAGACIQTNSQHTYNISSSPRMSLAVLQSHPTPCFSLAYPEDSTQNATHGSFWGRLKPRTNSKEQQQVQTQSFCLDKDSSD